MIPETIAWIARYAKDGGDDPVPPAALDGEDLAAYLARNAAALPSPAYRRAAAVAKREHP